MPEEQSLCKRLKLRVLGLAVIERARRSQAARLRELKLGDANTKIFHRRINARRRKNFIQRLKKRDAGWVTTHEEKAAEIQSHFTATMQRPPVRHADFNWDLLGIRQHDLRALDDPFSEQEIKNAIDQMPGDKSPGPDGFTSAFLKACWGIIKKDIMEAANAFHCLRLNSLQLINSANIILIPKKDGADTVGDFRPISLIHSFVKVITKALALSL